VNLNAQLIVNDLYAVLLEWNWT